MKGSNRRRHVLAMLIGSVASVGIFGQIASATEPTNSGLQTVVVQQVALQDPVAPAAMPESVVVEGQPMDSVVTTDEVYPEPVQEVYEPPKADPAAAKKKAAAAKKKKEAATAKMKGAFAGVFYGNDFSYLDDPCYDGPDFCGDSFKRMCDGRLDIGAESRVRYHSEKGHRGLGVTGRDDDFWLTRQRAFANWRVCDDIRLFGEVIYADSSGEVFAPRPIEENHMDVQNLLVDVKLFDGDSGKLLLRGGRQELIYGAQRLLSPLDWANTRRTFDGVRSLYSKGDLSVDAFYTKPVIVNRDDFDEPDDEQHLYGLYATHAKAPVGLTDLYYIGYNNSNDFNATRRTGDFDFHTIGSRIIGPADGNVLYEVEGGVQFGTNTDDSSHGAGFFTGGLGKKLDLNVWKPTVWGWYDYASGDDNFANAAEGDNGFHHLFPLGHKYNGFMDLFGRRNLHDINAQVITPINEKVSFLVWYHYFLLDELTTPYSVVMTPFNTANAAGDRELGSEIDLLFDINLTPRRNIQLGYSHFTAGDYYDTTAGVPTNSDADFFYAQYQSRY